MFGLIKNNMDWLKKIFGIKNDDTKCEGAAKKEEATECSKSEGEKCEGEKCEGDDKE